MKNYTMQIFKILKGQWNFKRTISKFGNVRGVAVFEEIAPGALHYREDGLLLMEGNHKPQKIYKEYYYFYLKKEKKIIVRFSKVEEQESFFHVLTFEKRNIDRNYPVLFAMGEHKCVDDFYEVSYLFFNDDKFKIIFNLRGPKKDYVLETNFQRGSI
jgi:hypothetical protein